VDEKGGLGGALVFVIEGAHESYPPPSSIAELRISRCSYSPPTLAVRVGQTLSVKNDDPLKHFPHARNNPKIEIPASQPPLVEKMVFSEPFAIELVRCYLHGWERAWVAVLPHPHFAVTETDGSFVLPALPSGKYRLRSWHPEFEPAEYDVVVSPGEQKTVDFSLPLKKSR
jgi:hypothetical protein